MGERCDLNPRKKRENLGVCWKYSNQIAVACKVYLRFFGIIKTKVKLGEPLSLTKRHNCKGNRKTTLEQQECRIQEGGRITNDPVSTDVQQNVSFRLAAETFADFWVRVKSHSSFENQKLSEATGKKKFFVGSQVYKITYQRRLKNVRNFHKKQTKIRVKIDEVSCWTQKIVEIHF
jgi:hypothetical protein